MTILRASTRISIRWPPAPASEPTDTLVLSVGGYFVDLRVRTADQSIDWALAGERIVLSEEPRKSTPQPPLGLLAVKVKFDHRLSSQHGPDVAGEQQAADIGMFSKLPNGDDFETGEMAAPHLGGKIAPYEEVWRPLDFSLLDNAASGAIPIAFVLESISEDNGSLQAEGRDLSWYARVGRFFLGVRQRVSDGGILSYDAVRQEWDEEKGSWVTRYSIGECTGLWKIGDLGNGDDLGGALRPGASVALGTGEKCIVRSVG